MVSVGWKQPVRLRFEGIGEKPDSHPYPRWPNWPVRNQSRTTIFGPGYSTASSAAIGPVPHRSDQLDIGDVLPQHDEDFADGRRRWDR